MAYTNREDQAAASKRHYDANRQVMIDRAALHRKNLINRMRVHVRNLKETTPCADCDKIYPYWVMEFDHRPGTDKKFNIATTGRWTSEKVVLDEIDKCDIVCSNCHSTRTYARQFGHNFVDLDDMEAYLSGEVDTPTILC